MAGIRAVGRRHLAQAAVAVAGALSMLLLVVSPARASWTPVTTLTLSGWEGEDSPAVAADRHGDRILVWSACNTTAQYCYSQIQARIKFRGGRLGRVKTLTPFGWPQSWPQVAADDVGDSAVVWQDSNSKIFGRRMSATGSLGPLRTLIPASAQGITPTVVVAPRGRALAAWPQYQNGGWTARARYFLKNGSLGPLMNLGSSSADKIALGMDRQGHAVAAWADASGRVVARRIRPGHVSPIRVIMPAQSGIGYGMVTVGDDRDGDAVVCFLRSINSGSGGPAHVWARRWHRTGGLGTVLHLSARTRNVTFYHAQAADFAGDTMVVWSQWTDSAQTAVFGRRISHTGSLGPITRLGLGDRPAVTVADDGHGLAAWQSLPNSNQVTKVDGRTFSKTGTFHSQLELSSDGRVVRTASSPSGRFSIIWQQSSAPWRIRARFGP